MNFKTILTAALFALTIISATRAQDMTPPKPVESSFFDKWVGEWKGENEYGGKKGKQTVMCKWDLNHQFLVINVKGTFNDIPDALYNGIGYYTLDYKGDVQGYWFDIYGANGISTTHGKITGNKMENNVTAAGYSSTELAEFKSDNEVSMVIKGTYEVNGQKMPFEHTATYIRK